MSLSFGYPGDGGLGDRLLTLALSGAKTATSSLEVEYRSGEPMPVVGERVPLIDHAGVLQGLVETTEVRVVPLDRIGDDVAAAEGEGYADADDYRRGHVAFWTAAQHLVREDAGDPDWTLRPDEPVIVHFFRLVERAGPSTSAEHAPIDSRT